VLGMTFVGRMETPAAGSHDRGCCPGTISFPINICIPILSIECHNSTPIGGCLVVWWVLLVERRALSAEMESVMVFKKKIQCASHKRTSAYLFSAKTALSARKNYIYHMRLA